MSNLWQFIVDGAKQIMLSGSSNVNSFEDYIQSLQPNSWKIEGEWIENKFKITKLC
jgi:hypothetical protein